MTDNWTAEAEARGLAFEALGTELRAALATHPDWSEATYTTGVFTRRWPGTWEDPACTTWELRLCTHNGKDLVPTVYALKYRHRNTCTDEIYATTVAEALAWIDTPRSQTSIVERSKEAEMRALEAAAAPKRFDLGGLAATLVDSGLNGKRQQYQVLDVDDLGRVRLTLTAAGVRIMFNRRHTTVPHPGPAALGATVRAALESLAPA